MCMCVHLCVFDVGISETTCVGPCDLLCVSVRDKRLLLFTWENQHKGLSKKGSVVENR